MISAQNKFGKLRTFSKKFVATNIGTSGLCPAIAGFKANSLCIFGFCDKIRPINWDGKYFGAPLEQEDSVVYPGKVTDNYPYSKSVNSPDPEKSDLNQRIAELKLEPENDAAKEFLTQISDSNFKIIAGNAGNISERNLSELNGAGLLCIMLNRSLGKSVHQSSDINKLLNSRRLGASDIIEADSSYKIPFVILPNFIPTAGDFFTKNLSS